MPFLFTFKFSFDLRIIAFTMLCGFLLVYESVIIIYMSPSSFSLHRLCHPTFLRPGRVQAGFPVLWRSFPLAASSHMIMHQCFSLWFPPLSFPPLCPQVHSLHLCEVVPSLQIASSVLFFICFYLGSRLCALHSCFLQACSILWRHFQENDSVVANEQLLLAELLPRVQDEC